ncbi:hypothetical protein [Salinithrix halophila]|uniref:DUF5666 domain-containing protein n=1 Tax=Salinithrix halophila TaxID=1485204 RepID=A0ABV8JBJ4_9BACL
MNTFKKLSLSLMLATSILLPFGTVPTQAAPITGAYGEVRTTAKAVVTVDATIKEVRGYDEDREHQHLLVDDIRVQEIENGSADDIPNRAFVSIRIDEQGTEKEIPNLRAGAPIEIKGEFIPEEEAYETPHNCCDAVIHFTHDPLGYVRYDGTLYR